jgi:hypothetical protein
LVEKSDEQDSGEQIWQEWSATGESRLEDGVKDVIQDCGCKKRIK